MKMTHLYAKLNCLSSFKLALKYHPHCNEDFLKNLCWNIYKFKKTERQDLNGIKVVPRAMSNAYASHNFCLPALLLNSVEKKIQFFTHPLMIV